MELNNNDLLARLEASLEQNVRQRQRQRKRGLGDMEMSVYDARMAAHDATDRKHEAGLRLTKCWDSMAPHYRANQEYDARLAEYKAAAQDEEAAWKYAWKREREERY